MKLTIKQICEELKKVDKDMTVYEYDEKLYCYINGKIYRLFTFGPYGYQVIPVI